MTTLKALQEQLGVSNENTRTERTSLDMIMQQVNSGTESDRSEADGNESDCNEAAEVRDILEHILWCPVSSCSTGNGFSLLNDYADVFRMRLFNVDSRYSDILPEEKDVTVADCLVAADWYSMNFKGEKLTFFNDGVIKHQEYAFCRPLWELFYNMAYKDSYFKKLRGVKVCSLMKFLQHKDGYYRDIPAIDCGLNDSVTLGWMLDCMAQVFNGWDPGLKSIEWYEDCVYMSCREMQSINHAICSAYFDVDARVAYLMEKASDTEKLGELFAEEKKYREELQKGPRLAV